jgi:hypothetical protein
MRSTVAGIAGILMFGVLQWFAKTFFASTLEDGGIGRDIISTIVLGGTFATFFGVWFFYSRRTRMLNRRRRTAPRSTTRLQRKAWPQAPSSRKKFLGRRDR